MLQALDGSTILPQSPPVCLSLCRLCGLLGQKWLVPGSQDRAGPSLSPVAQLKSDLPGGFNFVRYILLNFLIAVITYLTKQMKGVDIWLIVWGTPVHQGGDDMVAGPRWDS